MPALHPSFAYISGHRERIVQEFTTLDDLTDYLRTLSKDHGDAPEQNQWNWRSYVVEDSVQIGTPASGGYTLYCLVQHHYLFRDPEEIEAVYFMTWDDFIHRRWTRKKREAHFLANQVSNFVAQHA